MEVHQASFIIQVKEMLISDSLTCTRCNGLCIPVLETSNKYVCLKCEYRFSNSKHKFYYVTHEKFYDPKRGLLRIRKIKHGKQTGTDLDL